jgi:hypothetical protein
VTIFLALAKISLLILEVYKSSLVFLLRIRVPFYNGNTVQHCASAGNIVDMYMWQLFMFSLCQPTADSSCAALVCRMHKHISELHS